MLGRREFFALAAGAAAAPRLALGQNNKQEKDAVMNQAATSQTFFYASLGPALKLYRIDPEQASLTPGGTATLPQKVQYAWPHPSAPFLYVGSSDGGSSSLGVKGDKHYLSALRIDKSSGELQMHGASASLRSRPIHVNVDYLGRFVLVA
ncbi:MAG: beta-propeller fold lactonase family protein, partial [Bradyrhizobium sp.]|nr:beta-propeller fold lactonase family protein [Bradyrhizobium sp.]